MNPSLLESRASVPAALALGLCFIVAAMIGAYAFYKVHTLDNTLTVTGSATQDAVADSATWSISLSRAASEGGVAAAQVALARDAKQVSDFLVRGGAPAEAITTSPSFVDQQYSQDQYAPQRYVVRTDVTLSSDDPQLVQKLAKEVSALAAQGIVVSAQTPAYYLSNLPALRIALIGKAVSDAKARAEEIAKSTGRSVGELQSASGGVVQVLAPNSIDVSDYGNYDTSTIAKRVMVTARATFYLR